METIKRVSTALVSISRTKLREYYGIRTDGTFKELIKQNGLAELLPKLTTGYCKIFPFDYPVIVSRMGRSIILDKYWKA